MNGFWNTLSMPLTQPTINYISGWPIGRIWNNEIGYYVYAFPHDQENLLPIFIPHFERIVYIHRDFYISQDDLNIPNRLF